MAFAIALIALTTSVTGRLVLGQEQTAKVETRTTAGGVYTAEQAARGETTFANICQGCHTTADYTASSFPKRWNGQPLGDFFALISDTMPEDFPGSLKPEEYVQIIAYVLKLNRAPTGPAELPTDQEALNRIRFEILER